MPEHQLELETAIQHHNQGVELSRLAGGIPQSHKWAHKNSIKSFKELKADGRHAAILDLCRREARPLTDRQIVELLGFSDMNSCRPRVSELVDFGYLIECGNVRDSVTGKTVRQVKLCAEK